VTLFNGGLYLVGYCHVRKAVRIFAMERIRALDVLRTRFTMPVGFDAQEYLKDAWGIVRGELVAVKVIFAKSVARYIEERLWHPSREVRQLDDGGVEITLRVADTVEVRRWILGYGAQAEVVEPASLREALRAEAEAMVRRFPPMAAAAVAVWWGGSADSRRPCGQGALIVVTPRPCDLTCHSRRLQG
jgi:predicted DNA-binding transcriptional regulator YafY